MKEVLTETSLPAPLRYQQRFLVKNRKRLLSIRVSDVALFYAEGRINFMKTTDNKKFIIPQTMESLMASLDPSGFHRVNRSAIVAFDAIKDMYAWYGGRVKITLVIPLEKELIVSKDKVAGFRKWLGE
jgi:DNA-binding LytR/AlgR family response regulator